MKKMAVLGPKGTYSDIAAKKFLSENNIDLELIYYPSILKTSEALKENEFAIFPFENTLDGFVMESVDYIINNGYHIIYQLKLPIDFVFISNEKDIKDIKNLYVQFKTYGQCIEFIKNNNFNIIKTESNTQTLNDFLKNEKNSSAIIPIHLLNKKYNIEKIHIQDKLNNETRFFIVSKNDNLNLKYDDLSISILITIMHDKSGVLYHILKEFNELDINLNSILSRPMKSKMGEYKFYIECNILKDRLHDLEKLKKNLNKEDIKLDILGIYNKMVNL